MRDLFAVLGLDSSASPGQVKHAYRVKAKVTHPDVGGSVEEFEAVNEAYRILSDPTRRAKYEEYGETDDVGGADLDAEAYETINLVVTDIIAHANDLLDCDLVWMMRTKIERDIASHRSALKGLSRQLDRAQRLFGRFKVRDGGDNPLDRQVRWHKSGIEEKMRERRTLIARMERALILLSRYQYVSR